MATTKIKVTGNVEDPKAASQKKHKMAAVLGAVSIGIARALQTAVMLLAFNILAFLAVPVLSIWVGINAAREKGVMRGIWEGLKSAVVLSFAATGTSALLTGFGVAYTLEGMKVGAEKGAGLGFKGVGQEFIKPFAAGFQVVKQLVKNDSSPVKRFFGSSPTSFRALFSAGLALGRESSKTYHAFSTRFQEEMSRSSHANMAASGLISEETPDVSNKVPTTSRQPGGVTASTSPDQRPGEDLTCSPHQP